MSLTDERISKIAMANIDPYGALMVREFVRAIEQEVTAPLQCKIDSLMLEYCPDEMTEEQIETWGEHQASVEEVTGKQEPDGSEFLGHYAEDGEVICVDMVATPQPCPSCQSMDERLKSIFKLHQEKLELRIRLADGNVARNQETTRIISAKCVELEAELLRYKNG